MRQYHNREIYKFSTRVKLLATPKSVYQNSNMVTFTRHLQRLNEQYVRRALA